MTAFVLRMAWRETRGAWRHVALFVACIALGVAALVGVGTFATNLERTLGREARALMGGDVELRSARPLGAAARQELERLRRENSRLTHRLKQAETIIEFQKKVADILGIPLKTPPTDEDE